MITCNLMGGLGNQLFQIFATISYSILVRQKFGFINFTQIPTDSPETTVRYTYWSNLLDSMRPFLMSGFSYDVVEKEQNYQYNKLNLYGNNVNILLHGYFQSYKYFKPHYNIIYRLMGFDNKKNALLKKLNLKYEQFDNYIGLHFRLGDYKKLPNYHPIMSYEYYKKSLEFILSKTNMSQYNVFYFCEDEDIEIVNETINTLKKHFTNITFIKGTDNLSDWEQLLLMSLCHHNVIANSSFSWWSAYLNSHSDKIVCYPHIWFGPLATHNTDDLCPPEWNKIHFS